VSGIGHQRRRIGNETVSKFDHDKGYVQGNGDNKGTAMIIRIAVVVMASM